MEASLHLLCEEIRRLADPCRIVLYGSKYTPSGQRLREVNLCLVVEDEPKTVERRLYRELDCEISFNLLVYSRDDWTRLLADKTSYASDIDRKGVVLYG